jgi:hypothetical protein
MLLLRVLLAWALLLLRVLLPLPQAGGCSGHAPR